MTVRIGLNSNQVGEKLLNGGGAFFESLLDSLNVKEVSDVTKKSLSKGYAFFYESGERVAISPMTNGVRYELILSISTRSADESSKLLPSLKERMMLVQERAKGMPRLDRIQFMEYVLEQNPKNAEALMWLGTDWLDWKDENSDKIDIEARWKSINRAINCFEGASSVSPCDSRMHFLLGSALETRANFAQQYGINFSENLFEEMERIITTNEVAIEVESISFLEGFNQNCDILCSGLIGTATKLIMLRDYERALSKIDDFQRYAAMKYPFAIEKIENTQRACLKYQWIKGVDMIVGDGSKVENVAIRTVDDEPLLSLNVVRMIREAAEKHWEKSEASSSRFSMQYEGNSEVHLNELCEKNFDLKCAIDNELVTKIYPLVRSAFSGALMGVPETSMCVYDSIMVRYNGDLAKSSGLCGASQPLVRKISGTTQ